MAPPTTDFVLLTTYHYSFVTLVMRSNLFGCDVNNTSPGIIHTFPTRGVKVMMPETSAVVTPQAISRMTNICIPKDSVNTCLYTLCKISATMCSNSYARHNETF